MEDKGIGHDVTLKVGLPQRAWTFKEVKGPSMTITHVD